MAPSGQALNGASQFQLYDSECLLNMEDKVASGYVVLMGGIKKGGKDSSPKELDRGATNLGFMALTEGNVVDACFGVKQSTPKTNRAAKNAEEAKTMINDAVRSSESVRATAVKAYGQAFQVVLEYNEGVKKLNCITRCFRSKPLRQKAEQNLRDAFRPLNEAIEAAN